MMNKVYCSVWNESLNSWVAIREIDQVKGKTSGSQRTRSKTAQPAKTPIICLKALAYILPGAGMLPVADAYAETWVEGGDNNWSNSANWGPASPPNGNGASAAFNGVSAPSLNGTTIDLNSNRTLGNLLATGAASINKQNLTLSGSSFTFNNGGAGATITLDGGMDLTIAKRHHSRRQPHPAQPFRLGRQPQYHRR